MRLVRDKNGAIERSASWCELMAAMPEVRPSLVSLRADDVVF